MAITFNHNDKLYVSGSNVGIGTSSPAAKLSVEVASTADVIKFTRDAGANGEMTFDFSGANSNFYSAQGGFTFSGSSSSYGVSFTAAGSVGIGTTSPGRKLHVNSGTTNHVAIFESTDSTAYIQLKDSGAHSNIVSADGSLLLEADNGNELSSSSIRFSVDASEKMRIDSSGNVGIGTTSPENILHIQSPETTSTSNAYINIFGGHQAAGGSDNDGEAGLIFRHYAGSSTYYRAGAIISAREQNYSVTSLADSYLRFETAENNINSERMRITSAGNVGIGTTSPAKKLSVETSDTATYDPAVNASEISVSRKNSSNTAGQVAAISLNATGWSGQTTGVVVLNAIARQGNFSNADFAIQNRVGGNFVETFRITTYGNVGIGTDSPTNKLDVFSSTDNSRLIRISHPSSPTAAAGYLGFNTDGTTDNAIVTIGVQYSATYYDVINIKRENQNVGIGTTNPNQKLHILNGNILIQNETQGGDALILFDNNYTQEWAIGMTNTAGPVRDFVIYETSTGSSTDATNPRYIFNGNGDGIFQITDAADGDINVSLNTNGDSYLNGGNVGIGTTSPGHRLHVKSTSTSGTIAIGADLYPMLLFADATTGEFRLDNRSSAGAGFITFYPNGQGTTIGSEAMRVDTNGNVGIGTTSPSEKLEVAGNIKINYSSEIIFDDNNSLGQSFIKSGGFLNLIIDSNNNQNVAALIVEKDTQTAGNGTELFRVQEDGNVGIGTTSPVSKFTVRSESATHQLVAINRSASNTAALYIGNDSDNEAVIAANNADLRIGRDLSDTFTEYVRIKNGTGNVGIGTTAPKVKLNIVGGDVQLDSGQMLSFYTGAVADVQNNGIKGSDTDDSLRFYTGASERVTIKAGNVGIGTTAPSRILHIRQDVHNGIGSVIRLENSTGGGDNKVGILLTDGTYNSWIKGGRYNSETKSFLSFETTDSEAVRIDGDGNVGIGTTSPNASLHIEKNGDQASSVKGITLSSGAAGTDKYLPAIVWSYGAFGTPDFAKLEAQRGGGTGGRMLFSVANSSGTMSEAIRIDESGNVGIGTTSPTQKLDVNGDIALKGTSVFNLNSAALTIGDIAGTDSVNSLKLTTAGDSTTVYLDDGGNVGIGTTSPDHKLHVASSTTFGTVSRVLKLDQAASGGDTTQPTYYGSILLSGSGYNWGAIDTIQTNPSASWTSRMAFSTMPGGGDYNLYERMCITNGGNVGIGTTSPGAKLDVAGNATFSSSVTATQFDVSSGNGMYNAGTNALGFQTSSLARVYISSGGNFGIGTTSPGSTLSVNGTNTPSVPLLDLTASGSGAFQRGVRMLNSGMSAGDSIMMAVGRSDNSKNMGQFYFYYAGNASNSNRISMGLHSVDDVFNILATGNVGIGTTNPSYKLTVDSGTADIGILTASSDSGSYVGFLDNATSVIPKVGAVGNKLILDASQYVGIKRTDPSYALDVSGTIRATGDVIAYSDARVKENVETIPNALDKVKAMRGVGYNKIGEEKRSIGVIAQEMLEVMPEVVSQDEQGMYSVAYGNLVGVLIESIKELEAKVEQLENKLDVIAS